MFIWFCLSKERDLMNILCFGDSNTWGYKPDKTGRFDEKTRWTGLLQQKLGPEYHIIEEGLCGRTTVFQDELRESRRGLDMVSEIRTLILNLMKNPKSSPELLQMNTARLHSRRGFPT